MEVVVAESFATLLTGKVRHQAAALEACSGRRKDRLAVAKMALPRGGSGR